ncbi:DUF1318 domain-containing protein [Entomomonas moraniae]|uniref:DUF1318 domain-containing protein n=1 Tax=Entomomonas moraniae TaxID=2213226 RepID=A0A3Q9JLW8_9GAMM|nr:YdbL family protein [Entomomonas moraniae]AZS50080.1 DUF1318 domain-containing protein [Entomomonas moraniae]
MSLRKVLTTALLATTLSLPVAAMSLNEAMSSLAQAKSAGLVGEMSNGYLGVVKNEGSASEIAQLINEARKKEYQALAKKNGITLNDIEKMAGQKAQEKTPAGQYININSTWKKK